MLFELIYKNMNLKDGIVYSLSIIFSIVLWVIVLSIYQINIQNHLDEKAGGMAYPNGEYICISDKSYSELTGKELILDDNEAVIINESTSDADMVDHHFCDGL